MEDIEEDIELTFSFGSEDGGEHYFQGFKDTCPDRDRFLGKTKPCIVIAGKPGSGKSTALVNILQLQKGALKFELSSSQRIVEREVIKNDVLLNVVDTPGLGALDVRGEEMAVFVQEAIKNKDCTLVYCLSVSPSSRLTEKDRNIIHDLSKFLGQEVWQKCVILFTFSCTAWREEFAESNNRDGYKTYIKHIASEFESILRSCAQTAPPVKTVFEDRERDDIIVLPIGKKVTSTKDVLPGVVIHGGCDWTDLVFTELLKKTAENSRKVLIALKYGADIACSTVSSVLLHDLARVRRVGATAGVEVGLPTRLQGLTSAFLVVVAKKRKIDRTKQRLVFEEIDEKYNVGKQ